MHERVPMLGVVTTILRDERGHEIERRSHKNTITNWAEAVIANLLIQQPTYINSTSATASAPTYIALGTGTSSSGASESDAFGFAEVYATRKFYTYRDILFAYTAQVSVNYLTTDPSGTFTEAMLLDQPSGSAAVGTGGVSAAATTLPLAAGAPSVQGSTTPGQYTTIYINDGANSEYASIATTAGAGASSWSLQAGLKYAHAASTPIVVFGSNLWAHVVFSGSGVTKGTGQSLTIQWNLQVTNS